MDTFDPGVIKVILGSFGACLRLAVNSKMSGCRVKWTEFLGLEDTTSSKRYKGYISKGWNHLRLFYSRLQCTCLKTEINMKAAEAKPT